MNGIDFKLVKMDNGFYDIGVNLDGDFITEDAFDTAIIVSLHTDARADASEVAEPSRRRGWAGNLFTPGIEMGGKLWLWFQSRLQDRVEDDLVNMAEEALAWFKDDGWTDVYPSATGEITGSESGGVHVLIKRPVGPVVKRYYEFFENTGDTLGT